MALFSSEPEALAFKEGFELRTPGDHTTWVTETFDTPNGEVTAVTVHFADSDDDDLRVIDRREETPRIFP